MSYSSKRCERCGKFYDVDYGGQIIVQHNNIAKPPIIARGLCSDCLIVLDRFLANKDIYNDEYNGGGWDD